MTERSEVKKVKVTLINTHVNGSVQKFRSVKIEEIVIIKFVKHINNKASSINSHIKQYQHPIKRFCLLEHYSTMLLFAIT